MFDVNNPESALVGLETPDYSNVISTLPMSLNKGKFTLATTHGSLPTNGYIPEGMGPLQLSKSGVTEDGKKWALIYQDGEPVRIGEDGEVMFRVNTTTGEWERVVDRWANIEMMPTTVEEVAKLPEIASAYEDFDAYLADMVPYEQKADELARLHLEKRLYPEIRELWGMSGTWTMDPSASYGEINFGVNDNLSPVAVSRMGFNGQDGLIFTYAVLLSEERNDFYLVHFYLDPVELPFSLGYLATGSADGMTFFMNTQIDYEYDTSYRDELLRLYGERGLQWDLYRAFNFRMREKLSLGILFPVHRVWEKVK
jgi:hypothetical protein